MHQVILRFSLDNDTGSMVWKAVQAVLVPAGFAKAAQTNTWKAPQMTHAVSQAIGNTLDLLQNPTHVPGANPNVTLDHVWLYVE